MEVWAVDGIWPVGAITTMLDMSITERDLAVGGWTLTLPITEGASQAWQFFDYTYPGIEVYDPETGWRFGGHVTRIEETYDPEAGDQVVISGLDGMGYLQDRLDWPAPFELANFWANTYSGNVQLSTDILGMVQENASIVSIDPHPEHQTDRRIPNLTMAPDPFIGPIRNRHIVGQPLLEVIKDAFTDQPYTCRLRLERDAASPYGGPSRTFRIYNRPVSSVILDATRGTLGRVTVITEADAATRVIVMGGEFDDGDPGTDARILSVPVPPTGNWRHRYVEQLQSRPSIGNQDALNTEAVAILSSQFKPRTVQIEGAPIEGYGRDLDVGWFVDVAIGRPGNQTIERLPVVGSKLTFRPEQGWRRTVDVGTRPLQGPEAMFEHIARLAHKIRVHEGQLGHV